MPRILSVCRTLPEPAAPGAGVFVFNRLHAMAKRAELRVLQPVPWFPLLRPMPAWARVASREHAGLMIHHQGMFYIPGAAKSLDGRWLARSVRRDLDVQVRKPDLIDAHFGYPDGVGCVQVARERGIPVFVTIRGLEADRMVQPRTGRQIVDALNATTGCISVSHALRQVMIDNGVDGGRIEVIPNAVDRTLFHPGNRATARAALGIPQSRRMVLAVGYLIRRKRHDILMRAFAQLAATEGDIDLVIVGDAGHEPETPATLQRLAGELGLAGRLRFIGGIAPTQVATWLQAADVFALATAREGCCNAVLEALATGVPVVTTRVGDNPYYVADDRNGYITEVDDVDALARTLRVTLNRQWDAAAISAGLDVGTWDGVAARVLDYFARRLDGR